ncbi:MAG: radical SAM protein, partial [Candidatus Aenigmatarchaeota archaeon]
MRPLRLIKTLCPECVEEKKWDKMKINGLVYEKGGKVFLLKNCEEHGVTEEVYYEDYEMYKRFSRYRDPGIKIRNPNIKKNPAEINCPLDCGLCSMHRSHTALGNIVVTNRCDLSCWYCFFYAKEGDRVYEPSLEQIRDMLRSMRDEDPVGANAVQITGGEPTIRDDIVEIVRIAKEEGYDHVQFNTNGITFAMKPELVKTLKREGANVVYMSFDGVDPKANPKNYWEAPLAIQNCRAAKMNMVLVPTVIRSINDHQL